ncbi:cytochrome P450 [Setomelanomma holmii]|uniref:Cytochrome P450 n=1 Tax=Setomelanomma holmii TaxID=210430 RepID=A0A9P4GYR0_9PLEO|nr:cytochrome P450 [Setomelanomma holmii]
MLSSRYTCYFGGKPNIFVNSSRVVNDLMEKRATIYSLRPYCSMTQEIMSGGVRMLLMPHTNRWRNQRKIMHSILNGKSAEAICVPYQELEARQLIYDYLKDSSNFHVCNQSFSDSVITSVVFGRRSGLHDKQLKGISDLVKILGQYLFHLLKTIPDVFPWLHNLPKPLQRWRRGAEEYFTKARALYKLEFDAFEKKLAARTARPCFAAGLPEWVKKARSLLDEVCGANADRLPSLTDQKQLPHMSAVMKEVLRWRPFIQTGVPHMLQKDNEYEGYRFPPAPKRFANSDLNNPLKGHWQFGAGRRVCVGYNVGANNIWLAVACLLYCFVVNQDPDHSIDTFNTVWDVHKNALFKVQIETYS